MIKSLFEKKSVVAYLIVYTVMLLLGIVTMIWPEVGYWDPTVYSSILFFTTTFFSLVFYFLTRKQNGSYELLYFTLITVLTASYLFAFDYTTLSYVLGTGFLIFAVLTSINKLFQIDKLKKDNNSLWMLRAIFLILVLFFSVLTIQNFYREISMVQTIMIGYYLLSYGFLSIIEVLLLASLSPQKFEQFINGEFGELKTSNKNKKLKKITKFNENVDELDEIVKKVKISNKKKKINKKR